MELVWLIILIALAQYIFFTGQVGAQRGKLGVSAPKTVGDDTWEAYFRVQQNTLEQLIVFVPAMIAFATFVSAQWALLPGVLFVIGRQIYFHGYTKDPEKRAAGAGVTILTNIALVLGAMIGVVIKLI